MPLVGNARRSAYTSGSSHGRVLTNGSRVTRRVYPADNTYDIRSYMWSDAETTESLHACIRSRPPNATGCVYGGASRYIGLLGGGVDIVDSTGTLVITSANPPADREIRSATCQDARSGTQP